MKKLGFTLAEVLIALGLVGIVASFALPSLTKASQQASVGAQLAKTQNAIEEAVNRLVLEYADDVKLTELEGFESKISEHLIMKSVTGGYKLKDGVVISFSAGSGTVPEAAGTAFKDVSVDVNGAPGPNRSGVDKFRFTISSQGLIFPQGCAKEIQENKYKSYYELQKNAKVASEKMYEIGSKISEALRAKVLLDK